VIVAPEVRYAQSGDLSIAYQVVGHGPVDLIVVPGMLAWDGAARRPRMIRDHSVSSQPAWRLIAQEVLACAAAGVPDTGERAARAPG
jgi:hypothetical protein